MVKWRPLPQNGSLLFLWTRKGPGQLSPQRGLSSTAGCSGCYNRKAIPMHSARKILADRW